MDRGWKWSCMSPNIEVVYGLWLLLLVLIIGLWPRLAIGLRILYLGIGCCFQQLSNNVLAIKRKLMQHNYGG